ncbi:MAG: hypothetical protein AVDCRST_MAG83-1495, partial [uncultured Arthrobacter sp.]
GIRDDLRRRTGRRFLHLAPAAAAVDAAGPQEGVAAGRRPAHRPSVHPGRQRRLPGQRGLHDRTRDVLAGSTGPDVHPAGRSPRRPFRL